MVRLKIGVWVFQKLRKGGKSEIFDAPSHSYSYPFVRFNKTVSVKLNCFIGLQRNQVSWTEFELQKSKNYSFVESIVWVWINTDNYSINYNLTPLKNICIHYSGKIFAKWKVLAQKKRFQLLEKKES